jgi:hypothetical protein
VEIRAARGISAREECSIVTQPVQAEPAAKQSACSAPAFRSPVTGRTDRGPGFQRRVETGAPPEFAARMQPVLDRLRPYCAGQSASDAARRLDHAWQNAGGTPLPEPLRTTMATILAYGERVVLV